MDMKWNLAVLFAVVFLGAMCGCVTALFDPNVGVFLGVISTIFLIYLVDKNDTPKEK
jgi:hypothetical protein